MTDEQRGPGPPEGRAAATMVQTDSVAAGGREPLSTAEEPVEQGPASSGPSQSAWWSTPHLLFVIFVVLGAGLRVAMMIGLRPILLTDASQPYLRGNPSPSGLPMMGYSLFELRPVTSLGGPLSMAVGLQHVGGVAVAIALYLLLLRWGVWRWLAAVATAPALLDMRVVTAEHLLLPQSLFVFLIAAALLLVGWRKQPPTPVIFVFGVLLGTASTVLPVAIALLPVAIAFTLLAASTAEARVVSLVAVVLGFGLPFAAYLGWQHDGSDTYPLSALSGVPLHGASASDVESAISAWVGGSVADTEAWRLDHYVDQPSTVDTAPYFAQGLRPLSIHPPAAEMVRMAANFETTVPVLLAALLLGLAGAVGLGRTAPTPMRAVCGLLSVLPLTVPAASLAAGSTSWGDGLLALMIWPVAGAVGLTAAVRGRRGRSAARPQSDEIDRRASLAFEAAYGRPAIGPVVVVIAAYNEAAGLPPVLDRIPDEVCALATDVVIVDDGSTDETCSAARANPRAYLVRCPVNRGQGAALRLGYAIARAHGARYILTTDADGQYDTADFPRVLAPVVAGHADFVTGSRTLGHQHTYDRVRRAGVHVFAWIVSAFVGQRVTDTSFGLRAMRADATGVVTLNQPQYQSSELLIGMLSHGFTVAEVPGTMHQRSAGSTKKGRNLVYGSRYARVVFGTWWREACPTPVTDVAPALAGRIGHAAERS